MAEDPQKLMDLSTQNPMLEIHVDKDYLTIFVKDILRIETISEYKDYRNIYRVVLFYKDGKHTTYSWENIQKRDLLYEKIMNLIRGCYPVLKVEYDSQK